MTEQEIQNQEEALRSKLRSIYASDLSSCEKLLLISLACYDVMGTAFPTQSQLAEDVALDPRHVSRLLTSLRKREIIRQHSCEYTVQWENLLQDLRNQPHEQN